MQVYIHVTVHRNRFLLNNQPDALIIKILFCHKTLHVSGIFSAHHQEFSTVHSALVNYMQVLMTVSKQSGGSRVISAECPVENSWWWAQKMPETCTVLWQNKISIISASGWLLKRKIVQVINPFQPRDAIWHHAFHLFLICMHFAHWLQ